MHNHDSMPGVSRELISNPVVKTAQHIVYLAHVGLIAENISEKIADIRANGVFGSELIGGLVWRHTYGAHGFDPPVFDQLFKDRDQ